MRWIWLVATAALLGCGDSSGGAGAAKMPRADRADSPRAAGAPDRAKSERGTAGESPGEKPLGHESDASAGEAKQVYVPVDVANLGTRPAGVDWPDFLGPKRDNKSPEKGIVTDWEKNPPRVVWQKKLRGERWRTGGSVQNTESYASCTISKGRLLLFERERERLRLACCHSETGKEIWHYDYVSRYTDLLGYATGPRCVPVIDGDRVYLFGVEGRLSCVRLTDGKLIWELNTTAKFGVVQNFFGVGSTPIVEGDLLIANVGGSPPGSPVTYSGEVRGNGSGIVALDKYTGEIRYKITDELASYSSPVCCSIGGRRWCFVFARGGLVALEPKSGKVDFQYPWRSSDVESVNAASPVVVGDEVFISETYGPGSSLLKVRQGACDVLWRDKLRSRERAMQTHWNTPIYVDGYLYGSSGRHAAGADLRCIEWATGNVQWSQEGLTRSSLLYVDGHFVCLSEDGTLRLLRANPKKYDPVAAVKLRDDDGPLLTEPAWAAPVLSHGLLYVRGANRLVCLELIPEK